MSEEKGPLPPWGKPFELRVVDGAKFGDMIKAMVLDRLPDARFDIATNREFRGYSRNYIYGALEGADPWRDVQEMAWAYACTVTYDAETKTFKLREDPDVEWVDGT